uniref:Uncharacterized protein n=1 Tax=Glossina pallidipes TaxID=7398 RepID=A0A1A9Z6S6_GLOPL
MYVLERLLGTHRRFLIKGIVRRVLGLCKFCNIVRDACFLSIRLNFKEHKNGGKQEIAKIKESMLKSTRKLPYSPIWRNLTTLRSLLEPKEISWNILPTAAHDVLSKI